MKNRIRVIVALTIMVPVLFLLFGKQLSVSAQERDDDIQLFFPLFAHEEDPYYAYGLDGGTVEGISIDPTDSNILYANSWGAGIFKSMDGGQTWVDKSDGLETGYVFELAIDPSNHLHLLASDYEHCLKQSFDGGDSWSGVSGITEGSVVYSIEFNPKSTNIVYIAVREPTIYENGVAVEYPGGVFKSTNGGTTWVKKSNGLSGDYIYDLAIDPNTPSTVYTAMHETGVYKTVDGGGNWVAVNDTMIDGDVRSVQVTPDSSRVYIGFWDGYGMSYSRNGGSSWTSVSWTNAQDLFVYEVQVDPNHPSSVYLTTSTGIYLCESPSSGSTCEVFTQSGRFVFDLALDENGPVNASGYTKVMYTGLQNFAIFKSSNAGSSFEPSYDDIHANIINIILIDPTDPSIQYVSSQGRGLFRTTNNGTSWTSLHSNLPVEYINDLAFSPLDSNTIYAATKYNGIFVSYDRGQTWLDGNSGLNRSAEIIDLDVTEVTPAEVYDWMDPVDQEMFLGARSSEGGDRSTSIYDVTTIGFHRDSAQSQNMFIGTNGSGVKLSSNGGLTWNASGLSGGVVTDSIINPAGSGGKYFISLEGAGVKSSTDMNSWTNMSTGLPAKVYCLTFIPGTNTYFAGTNSGIYRTPGTSSSWSIVGLSGKKVTDIVVDPIVTTRLFATTKVGLYYSTNSGTSWGYYSLPDLPNTELLTIESIPGTSTFLIGTNGGDQYLFSP